jgi:hypothetical protein
VRRAKVLAASLGMTQSVTQLVFIFAVFLAFPSHFNIMALAIVGFLMIAVADHSRKVALLPLNHMSKVSDRVRIGVVLAFALPIILYLTSKALGRFDPVTFSILVDGIFAKQLSIFVFLLLICLLPLYNDWMNRKAALGAADPTLEEPFSPSTRTKSSQALSL